MSRLVVRDLPRNEQVSKAGARSVADLGSKQGS
jgi:hypothetical protein